MKPRAASVYLARQWGRASFKEIGRRLHRDPSIISRLYAAYAADRDRNKELLIAKQLVMQYQRLAPTDTDLGIPLRSL